MKTLMIAKAAVEMLAGLAFVLFPSALFLNLLGVPLDAIGSYAFRMFGPESAGSGHLLPVWIRS